MAGSDEVGGSAGGFRVSMTPSELRIVVWGYWPADVSAAFVRRASVVTHALGPLMTFVLDANELKPQAAEAQEALRSVLRAVAASSFSAARVMSSNVLTRMQLARLIRECGLYGRAVFEESGS